MKTCKTCKNYFDVVFIDQSKMPEPVEGAEEIEPIKQRVQKCLILDKQVPIGVKADKDGNPVIDYCSQYSEPGERIVAEIKEFTPAEENPEHKKTAKPAKKPVKKDEDSDDGTKD